MSQRRKSLVGLGETELEVLQHVWALGEATVADVHARVEQVRPIAYTTVLTVMKNLAEKGYLMARREGTRDHYRAARSEEHVRGRVLQTLLDKLFGGSPAELVQTLVRREDMTADEIAALRRVIERLDNPEDGDG